MRSKNIICLLFISLVLASSTGCLAKESGAPTSNPAVPKDNLPEGFKLLAVLPGVNSNLNMTDYIKDFYGSEDIGPTNTSVGIYKWKNLDGSYDINDAKITLIQLSDEEHARAAVSNYKSQETYQNQLARKLPIFSNATVNGHETLEIKDIADNSIRYLYLWNTGSIVALVEGNNDRSKSIELASASGL
jgi:hypothetical protein